MGYHGYIFADGNDIIGTGKFSAHTARVKVTVAWAEEDGDDVEEPPKATLGTAQHRLQ